MATTAGAVDSTNSQLKEPRFTEDFGDGGQAINNNNNNNNNNSNNNNEPNTLKKNESIGRKLSLRKSGSKRVPQNDYSQQFAEESNDLNSALVSPIPTQVNPTEILAARFNNWRRVLKEFATFFKEVASQYEIRAKSFSRVQSTLNTTLHGDTFLNPNGGLAQTHKLLLSFHNDQRVAAENARQIELQIVQQLNAVRNDLGQKVKEIKNLSSDFKNNVDKEKEATRKSIVAYLDALSAFSSNSEVTSKQDPFLVKLSVERQIRRLLNEENYLHRAYHNIESSGRELESIVVQEIQKAFRTYGEIVKNEGATNINFYTSLETILLQMPPDSEWSQFISKDPNFVSQDTPLRSFEQIHYPGYDNPATTEIRSGPLERKSKYLSSFSPGWFVLSPTHLHEFKSSDRNIDQTPVMSLYLPDSTIGEHSNPHAVNHKFMLKGKKTGALHRGHTWVFRAASYEQMMEWYEDIRKLTELSGPARDNFVGRRRTLSLSQKQSPVAAAPVNDIEEDYDEEEDKKLMADEEDVPYSVTSINSALTPEPHYEELAPPKRPEAGRFGSQLSMPQDGRYNSSEEAIAGVHGLPGGAVGYADNRPTSREYSNRDVFVPMNANAGPTDSGNFVDNDNPHHTLRKQQSGTFVRQPAQPTGAYGTENVDQFNLTQVPRDGSAPSSTSNQFNVPAAVFIPGRSASHAEPTFPTVGGYDATSPAPIAQNSYHPPAPVSQENYHPITAGAVPGQSQMGMNEGEGDAVIPVDPSLMSPTRPPKTPVPGSTSQSTLENIHIPGAYPRTQQ